MDIVLIGGQAAVFGASRTSIELWRKLRSRANGHVGRATSGAIFSAATARRSSGAPLAEPSGSFDTAGFIENYRERRRNLRPRKRERRQHQRNRFVTALMSQSAIVLYVPTSQVFRYWQAAACSRAARKSATYQSPPSPYWQPWCRRSAQ